MTVHPFFRIPLALLWALAALLVGCASPDPRPGAERAYRPTTALSGLEQTDRIALLNRVTWGANPSSLEQLRQLGVARYLDQQLHPTQAALPEAVQSQISAMTISTRSLEALHQATEVLRKEAGAKLGDEAKKAAQRAYQQEMTRLAREAATRSLLRALYSPNQLQEQLTWFWMNHFNVHQGKHNLRAMVGDYEEQAIRPHALGKFRDLLGASAYHPAMLRYLDNEQNAVNRLNENYARELLELHTLGVNGGYSQRDVQELARILTGVGVNLGTATPRVRADLQAQYLRRGLFEFNPNRHDYGDKQLLGQIVRGRGLGELDEVLDRLSRHPATARFISAKLAAFFVSDAPSEALLASMSKTFLDSDGDIAATLHTLLGSTEFAASLGRKFKDPVHYLVSAVRLAYDDQPILNATPLLNWLNRLGQPLYGRQTPDGYSMLEADWSSPGQMNTRFEIAALIASGNAPLFKTDAATAPERPALLRQARPDYFQALQERMSTSTRRVLEQAQAAPQWNTALLSAPEMMHR